MPGQEWLVTALAALQTLSGAPVTIHGDGTQQRQFTYVGDVAQLVAQAGFLPTLDFDVVNLGSDEVSSVADVVAAVEAASAKSLDVANTPVAADGHHVQVRGRPPRVSCTSRLAGS